MPVMLPAPTVDESLDTGELVVPAPVVTATTYTAPATAPATLSLPTIDAGDGNVFATLIAILLGIWVAKMILGLIPRFILIGVGIAILYAYLQ